MSKNVFAKLRAITATGFTAVFILSFGPQIIAAPSAGLTQTKQVFTVAFAQDTMANDWRAAQVTQLQNALSDDKSIRFIHTDAGGYVAKQIKDIEDLLFQGIDLLVTSPADVQALDPVVSRVYRKGIPVVLLDRRVASNNFTVFIAPDNRKIAERAAGYVSQCVSGPARILMLKGLPNATPTIHRTDAFVEAIKKTNKHKIVAEKTANYLRADAVKAVEEVVLEGVKFNVIYAQSDSMASGARIALKHLGVPLNTICIIGIDYIAEARKAIIDGQQSVSFSYPTGAQQGARYIREILAGQQVPKKVVIPSKRVTKANAHKITPIF